MRRRVSRVALATALVSLVLVAVPFAIGIRISFFADERTELERAALAAAVQVGPDFTGKDPVELPPAINDGQVAVYDRSLALRAGTGPQLADDITRQGLAGHAVQGRSGGSLIVAVPVASSEQVIGVVRASSPVSSVWTRVLLAWLAVLGGVLVALLFGAAVANWQARRLTAPLESLAGTADAVAAGDLSARAEPSGIAEVDTVAEAQNLMVDRLSGVLAQARRFATDAAHQLRTPLAGLRLTLEAAQADTGTDPRTALNDALERTGELQRTIQDVLALSRLPAEQPRPLGTVHDLVSAAEHRWHGLLAEQGRRLHLVTDPAVASRQVPIAAARQILDILIDNARTHGRGTVRVTVHDVLETTAMDVQDEGAVGTDVFSGPVIGAGIGPGIGLGLARDLAESVGARLALTSRSPTTFRLLIPELSGLSATTGQDGRTATE
jgi:signal transduction histidine kinase